MMGEKHVIKENSNLLSLQSIIPEILLKTSNRKEHMNKKN